MQEVLGSYKSTTMIPVLLKNIFFFMFLGFLLSKIVGKSLQKLTIPFFNTVIYILFPLFVLFSLWSTPIYYSTIGDIWTISSGVVGMGFLLALLFSRFYKVSFREHFLPIVFINSGYLGIPLNTFLFGGKGTIYAILFDIIPTFSIFTLGVYFIARQNPFKEVVRMPAIYATVAGLLLNIFHIPVPYQFLHVVQSLKNITIPVILVMVGYSLKAIDRKRLGKVVTASCLRMGGGLIAGLLLVFLADIRGVAAAVCIVSASMPSAVNSYVLAEKYQMNPDFSSQVVTLSTLLSLPYIVILSLLLR